MSDLLLPFYEGTGPDIKGRLLQDILLWTDESLEDVHDYIQWLFPLAVKSAYNSSAPILDEHKMHEFRRSFHLQSQLLLSFVRMLQFYGFEIRKIKEGIQICRSSNFELRTKNWLTRYNHNHLRITRILKCLCLTGLERYAIEFLNQLKTVYEENPSVISPDTFNYWHEAVKS